MDVRLQEPDGALAGRVVAEHDVAVRIDEPGADGCAAGIDDALGAGVSRVADTGDDAVLDQQRVSRPVGLIHVAGQQGTDVDDRGARHLGYRRRVLGRPVRGRHWVVSALSSSHAVRWVNNSGSPSGVSWPSPRA